MPDGYGFQQYPLTGSPKPAEVGQKLLQRQQAKAGPAAAGVDTTALKGRITADSSRFDMASRAGAAIDSTRNPALADRAFEVGQDALTHMFARQDTLNAARGPQGVANAHAQNAAAINGMPFTANEPPSLSGSSENPSNTAAAVGELLTRQSGAHRPTGPAAPGQAYQWARTGLDPETQRLMEQAGSIKPDATAVTPSAPQAWGGFIGQDDVPAATGLPLSPAHEPLPGGGYRQTFAHDAARRSEPATARNTASERVQPPRRK